MPTPPPIIAGYPYLPQALKDTARRPAIAGVADEFHVLLKEGGLAEVKNRVAARPELLADLLPIVANPEAAINVRIGASVIFESQIGSLALRALVPQLGGLSSHADVRVRADACFYLGLTGDARGRSFLEARLRDGDAQVREIAGDSLEMLAAQT